MNNPLLDNLQNEPDFHQIARDVEAKYQTEHERVRQWLEANDMLWSYNTMFTTANIVSYAILPVTPFAERRQKIVPVVQCIHKPFRHISFAELVQQAGLGSAFAELLSARC